MPIKRPITPEKGCDTEEIFRGVAEAGRLVFTRDLGTTKDGKFTKKAGTRSEIAVPMNSDAALLALLQAADAERAKPKPVVDEKAALDAQIAALTAKRAKLDVAEFVKK